MVNNPVVQTLPIFPLSTVLMPGVGLSLHIFEPRYRQLVVQLLNGTLPNRHFGVIAKRQNWLTEINQLDQLHAVGCTAKLREIERLPDGRFDITTVGEQRFRLLDLTATQAPYLIGAVQWLPDIPVPQTAAESMRELSETVRAAHRRYREAAWQYEDATEAVPTPDLTSLAHVVASASQLAMEDRQQILEELNPLRRLLLVRRILNRETVILRRLRAVPASLTDFGSLPSRN